MTTQVFCKFNSFCINPKCRKDHHYPHFERKLLFTVINESPEIAQFREDTFLFNNIPCKYGLRCLNKNCVSHHGINYDGRMILTQKFNNECNKNEEILDEIFRGWNLLD